MVLPRITIVTPSFNQGIYLEQTIDSVLSQKYSHLEYIIIDGGSDDESVEIIKKYEKHLAYWVSEKDKGQSDALIKGFNRSTGEVFNWLNSDDYYLPEALSRIGDTFLDPNVHVVCGRSQIIMDGQAVKLTSGTDIYTQNVAKTIGWSRIDQPETFFRMEVLKQLGFLNHQLHYVMDKDLWMRYLLHYGLSNVRQIPDLLAAFRWHSLSKTQTSSVLFDQETNALFYTLAKSINSLELAKEIESMGKKEVQLPFYQSEEKTILNDSLNYYFLQQVFKNYALNDFQMAKHSLRLVDTARIAEEDKKELQKISDRMKYPVAIKKLFNWLRK